MKTEDLLCISLDIGEKMLISGAEISRVEDSLCRILTRSEEHTSELQSR